MAATEIESLIQLLSRVPGLGPRSARRAVLFLLNKKESHLKPLISALTEVAERIQECPVCGNMDTTTPCSICSNTKRNAAQICVVQDVADLWALERANLFQGH